jgi:N-carbamoylputrescine amidase
VKLIAAAIQMPSQPHDPAGNRDRADAWLREAYRAGARLVVLPEMFNTGYGVQPDYSPLAETADGPTLRHLRRRSREWDMFIAGGFVERDGHHLFDSLALCTPEGEVHIYRKRNLVFWERFRFCPGHRPLIVPTRFGRIGLAICADMIYRRVWDGYRDRIDAAIIAAAWPEFSCRHTGRKNWLLGHIGPLSGKIPAKVAHDLGIPVIFANQCGPTQTTVPLLGMRLCQRITDRFAGHSAVCDGRHGTPSQAGRDEQMIVSTVTLHAPRRPQPCRSTSPSDRVVSFSASA